MAEYEQKHNPVPNVVAGEDVGHVGGPQHETNKHDYGHVNYDGVLNDDVEAVVVAAASADVAANDAVGDITLLKMEVNVD